jgi:DNA-binding response OmpR family regulator
MKLLIIEDEAELAQSIATYLGNNDFICDIAGSFGRADELIHIYEYDCILVDITLPDGSGMDIVRRLKTMQNKAGIIIISAKNALDDKLFGLHTGADDYLPKPFHLAELNARIIALVRRRQHDGNQDVRFNEIRLQPDMHQAFINDIPVELTHKEFALLLYLIVNRNRVLNHESIAEHLWGSQADLLDSFDFIYSHIKNLRKKLTTNGAGDYIRSVYGLGYRFGEV